MRMMNLRTSPIFVLFILLAFSVSADTADVADIKEAESLIEQGRAADALLLVDSMLASSPEDPNARFLRGVIQADAGEADSAIETFTALTQDHPELPEPWNNLAVLFADRGEFDKARESLLAAVQTHPSYTTAHKNLGDLYARMAGQAYDRALEQDLDDELAGLTLSAVNGLFSAPGASDVMVAAKAKTTPEAMSETTQEQAQEQEQTEEAGLKPADPVANGSTPQASDVEAAVQTWASAWAGKDVPGYLGSYSKNFQPSDGASFHDWSNYRRDRLSAPKAIKVDVSKMDVQLRGTGNATVKFLQTYRSDNYNDEVTKTLRMARWGGRWLIVSEVAE